MRGWALIVVLAAVGCGREPETPSPPAVTSNRTSSSMELAVDGFTGRYAIEAGHKAEDTIRRVSAEKDEALAEVLDAQ